MAACVFTNIHKPHLTLDAVDVAAAAAVAAMYLVAVLVLPNGSVFQPFPKCPTHSGNLHAPARPANNKY